MGITKYTEKPEAIDTGYQSAGAATRQTRRDPFSCTAAHELHARSRRTRRRAT